jgi:hypothetical protein
VKSCQATAAVKGDGRLTETSLSLSDVAMVLDSDSLDYSGESNAAALPLVAVAECLAEPSVAAEPTRASTVQVLEQEPAPVRVSEIAQ